MYKPGFYLFLNKIHQEKMRFSPDSTVMIRPTGYQAHRWTRKITKVLHEDLRWRVIYHQYSYGSSIKETENVLFTSTAFVSKIRTFYKQRGEVNRKRRKGRQRISCLFCLCLVSWTISWTIYASINVSLPGIGTDRENKVLEAMIRSKPELDLYRWIPRLVSRRYRNPA